MPIRPPVPGEQGAAEQVRPDGEVVVAPLVAVRPDTGEGGLVGKQRQVAAARPSAAFGHLGVNCREV